MEWETILQNTLFGEKLFKITFSAGLIHVILRRMYKKKICSAILEDLTKKPPAQTIDGYRLRFSLYGLLTALVKSNSTTSTVQVEANLQEQLSDHLHFRKLKCC